MAAMRPCEMRYQTRLVKIAKEYFFPLQIVIVRGDLLLHFLFFFFRSIFFFPPFFFHTEVDPQTLRHTHTHKKKRKQQQQKPPKRN